MESDSAEENGDREHPLGWQTRAYLEELSPPLADGWDGGKLTYWYPQQTITKKPSLQALRMSRTASYLLSTVVVLAVSASHAMADDPFVTIVTLGDSYINGYSISDRADRFSAKVAAGLLADGHKVVFQDVGFTNMSSDALRWLHSDSGQQLLANPAHHVLILETAQNDCGLLKLDASKANLDQILAALSSADIPVLIVGTLAYDYCGADYVAAYPTIFPDLATKYGELLYPDFKAGIEGRRDLLGNDSDHANAAGEAIIAANILPSVEALIARAR